MAINLAAEAKKRKIEYFLISFTDLFGVMRAKLVPAAAIAGMQKDGAGFAGFRLVARHDAGEPGHVRGSRPREPDPVAVEAEGRLARLRSVDGRQGSRARPAHTLKRVIAQADKKRLSAETRRRVRVFHHLADGSALADERDTQSKPCYDSPP